MLTSTLQRLSQKSSLAGLMMVLPLIGGTISPELFSGIQDVTSALAGLALIWMNERA